MSKDSKIQFVPINQVYSIINDPDKNMYHVNANISKHNIYIPNNFHIPSGASTAKAIMDILGHDKNTATEYSTNFALPKKTTWDYFPDLSFISKNYSSENIRKTALETASLNLEADKKNESQDYIQSIIHEGRHLKDFNGGKINMLDSKLEQFNKYYIDHILELPKDIQFAVAILLNRSRSDINKIHTLIEPRGIIAEAQWIADLGLPSNLLFDMRIMELMLTIAENNNPRVSLLDVCLEESYNLDHHVTGDILLFWGPDYFINDTNSHVDWGKMVKNSKYLQDSENMRICKRDVIVLAIVDKVRDYIKGKNILIPTEQLQELSEKMEKCWSDKLKSINVNFDLIKQLVPQIKFEEEAEVK